MGCSSTTLKRAGWRASDRYKRFLHTRRAGIDFHLGPARR
jgi:hypothetical protein